MIKIENLKEPNGLSKMIWENIIKATYIAKKDIKEYYLKPPTISWGIVFPVVFTLAFLFKGGSRSVYLIPGLIALSLFFGSTSMAAASIVFERKMGSFERLLLFPVSYVGIALGKVLSSFAFGILSLVTTIVVVIPFILNVRIFSILLVAVLILSALMFSAFGVLIAFLIKDPTNTMLILNSVRLPMIFLCGIFIPVSSLPMYLQIVAFMLPLTYSVEAIRFAIEGSFDLIPPIVSILSMICITVLLLILSAERIKKMIP